MPNNYLFVRISMYISRSLWINVPLQTDKRNLLQRKDTRNISKKQILKSNKHDTKSILLKIPFSTPTNVIKI